MIDKIGAVVVWVVGLYCLYLVHSCDHRADISIQQQRATCKTTCGNHPYELFGDKCLCHMGDEIK